MERQKENYGSTPTLYEKETGPFRSSHNINLRNPPHRKSRLERTTILRGWIFWGKGQGTQKKQTRKKTFSFHTKEGEKGGVPE